MTSDMKDRLLAVRTSDKMLFIISTIMGKDWVTCDRATGGFSITSDGFVVSGGLFLGSASDFERNVTGFLKVADLPDEMLSLFEHRYSQCVYDWRIHAPATLVAI